uniref:Exostosin GT47 domain-containing protein n=1 Tax=Brassica oleracea var. oleracea TaxID=109376 RepID=A0A0D3BKB0_BRAOL
MATFEPVSSSTSFHSIESRTSKVKRIPLPYLIRSRRKLPVYDSYSLYDDYTGYLSNKVGLKSDEGDDETSSLEKGNESNAMLCGTGTTRKQRTTLGFWAGHRNSKIRVILARVWENDTELDISNNRINRATGHLVYQKRFYRTKFCICPGGSQVNSARITDSIHYGCVPVILSDYYDLPFNDILDWRKFAVVLRERDVYDLKQILKNITQSEFVSLHNNLVKVQKHFQWNSPPVKFDAFHMIMYELWLRHHVIKY